MPHGEKSSSLMSRSRSLFQHLRDACADKSILLQLIAAPFAVLGYLLVPAILYGLVAIIFKYAYGTQVPKPFGWFH